MRNFLEVYKDNMLLIALFVAFWYIGTLGPLWYLLSPIGWIEVQFYWDPWYGSSESYSISPNAFTYTTTIYALASAIYLIVVLIKLNKDINVKVEDEKIQKYSKIANIIGIVASSILIIISILAPISIYMGAAGNFEGFGILHNIVKITGYCLIPVYLVWGGLLAYIPISMNAEGKIILAFCVFAIFPQIGGPIIAYIVNDMYKPATSATSPTEQITTSTEAVSHSSQTATPNPSHSPQIQETKTSVEKSIPPPPPPSSKNEWVCVKCGTHNPSNANFCMKCGEKRSG